MTYQMKLPIGDWSDDGHGECEYFTIVASKPVEDVREAHFQIEGKLGVNIHSFVNEYEEGTISPEKFLKLLEVPGFKEEFKQTLENNEWTQEKQDLLKIFIENDEDPAVEDLYDDDFEFTPSTHFMAQFWVFLLNSVDAELNIKFTEEKKIPMVPFYGSDEKGRHIGQIGYGCFEL